MSIHSENSQVRLCIVEKSYPEQEYGFNLHGEKGKKGQYIGSVDPGSPADIAGLRAGDKILAVNGTSVVHDDHKQVVAKIRENPLQCTLSVVYESHLIPVLPPTPPTPTTIPVQPPRSVISSTTPKPRLCRLNKTPSIDEYGFNLHAENDKGHFIGRVDKNSLAEAAGLVEGQRIVGVNRTLIYPWTAHKEVVDLIKQNPMCVLLLVANREVDEYFQKLSKEFNFDDAEIVHHNRNVVNGDLSNGAAAVVVQKVRNEEPMQMIPVQNLTITPDNVITNGLLFNVTKRNESNGLLGSNTAVSRRHMVDEAGDDEQSKLGNKSTSSENSVDRRQSGSISGGSISSNDAVAPSARTRPNGSTSVNREDDLFNLSSAELRQRVARNRRPDPRREGNNANNLTFEEKFKIINNL